MQRQSQRFNPSLGIMRTIHSSIKHININNPEHNQGSNRPQLSSSNISSFSRDPGGDQDAHTGRTKEELRETNIAFGERVDGAEDLGRQPEDQVVLGLETDDSGDGEGEPGCPSGEYAGREMRQDGREREAVRGT